MRAHRVRKTKTVCTYCGVGCSFDVWTKDRHNSQSGSGTRSGQWHFHLREGKVRLGSHQ